MNILKAILLTALLMGLEVLISFGVYEFIEPKVTNSLSSNSLIHYFGITGQIPTVIAYFIVFYLSYRAIFSYNKGIEKAKGIKPKHLLYLILITIGLEFFDRPLFDFSKIYAYFSDTELEPFEFSESSNLKIFYRGISVLIIAPIFEELFFRKFLFGELLKKHSSIVSVIVSSICFSIIHLPSYRNLLPTFIFGIIACLIYKKTRNIFYTIILHFLTNLSWLLLVSFGKSYYEWSYGLNYNFNYWLLFIFGIGLSYIGIKKITVANKELS
ncbi:CPBP family intramembrane glutamic endopeptidase [uncultured Aquimarina sp.]|uniref:CPBP family intramembrane glutamic endopeptidase n=1 Tax=uncultured Aquimarina sp. TaxID=575652 RepID=UPI00260973D3|nr:CPBP family intramembrane glutamic endopeptidase [uncultured Aquimarina sp.]